MVVFNPLLLLVALAQFTSLVLSQPVEPDSVPPLVKRSTVCYNAPNTQAGTFLKRDSLDSPDLSPRDAPFPGKGQITWCAPNCRTYIRVSYVSEIPAAKTNWGNVRTFISDAQQVCLMQLKSGDTVIPRGGWWYGHNFRANTYGLEVLFYNSNNHQLTWGVNHAALSALADYFDTLQKKAVAPGAVQFAIVDGENEVAAAAFGTEGQWTGH